LFTFAVLFPLVLDQTQGEKMTMAKRPSKPAGYSWVIPYLVVTDADAALDFYQRAFGLEKKMAMPGPDGKTKHAEMTWQGETIMFGPECATDKNPTKAPVTSKVPSPVALYLYCEDVDALFARAKAAGAQVVSPPTDQFYGDRHCMLLDPDGHMWSFATNVADFDPSKAPH
jgi:PhnB protein